MVLSQPLRSFWDVSIINQSSIVVALLLKASFKALSTFPAGLYLIIEKYVLRSNTPVVGARLVTPIYIFYGRQLTIILLQYLGFHSVSIRGY